MLGPVPPETRAPKRWPRALDLRAVSAERSCFVIGPPGTGKRSLARSAVRTRYVIDLCDKATFVAASLAPGHLRREVREAGAALVVEGIDRLPALLDDIAWLIDERGVRAVLTGTSIRKLVKGGSVPLGGRATSRRLHPLVTAELGEVDLLRALTFGTLPAIYASRDPAGDLRRYADDFLRAQLDEERVARDGAAFRRFVAVAALANGAVVNHARIADEAGVPRTTVHEYYRVLRETLLVYELPAWRLARHRKTTAKPKLFFFDVGVARALQGRGALSEHSADLREAFATWLFHELQSWIDYRRKGTLHYWKTTSGFEIDFVFDDCLGIAVNAKPRVSRRDLAGLSAALEERAIARAVVASLEPRARMLAGISIVPWRELLARLWSGDLTS